MYCKTCSFTISFFINIDDMNDEDKELSQPPSPHCHKYHSHLYYTAITMTTTHTTTYHTILSQPPLIPSHCHDPHTTSTIARTHCHSYQHHSHHTTQHHSATTITTHTPPTTTMTTPPKSLIS